MRTHALDLLFLPQPKDALPGPAISHVSVKAWHKMGYKIKDERPLLTSQSMSPTEIDHEIDQLKDELEAIAPRSTESTRPTGDWNSSDLASANDRSQSVRAPLPVC